MKRPKKWGATLQGTVPSFKETKYITLAHAWQELIESHWVCTNCRMVKRVEEYKMQSQSITVTGRLKPYIIFDELLPTAIYSKETPDGSIKEWSTSVWPPEYPPDCLVVPAPKPTNTRRTK
jgi:hypothetical protein